MFDNSPLQHHLGSTWVQSWTQFVFAVEQPGENRQSSILRTLASWSYSVFRQGEYDPWSQHTSFFCIMVWRLYCFNLQILPCGSYCIGCLCARVMSPLGLAPSSPTESYTGRPLWGSRVVGNPNAVIWENWWDGRKYTGSNKRRRSYLGPTFAVGMWMKVESSIALFS